MTPTRLPSRLARSRPAGSVWRRACAALAGFGAATGAGALALLLFGGQALGQGVTFDFGDGPTASGRIIQLMLLLTILSLAPGILMMVTSFTRIVIVLSFLRSALGVQQTPPNVVMVSLAMFLTAFIMAPTVERSYREGVVPLVNEEINETEAFDKITAPFRDFMLTHVRESDLRLFLDMSRAGPVATPEQTPLTALVPAFMISELRRAFEIGFLLFIPFIIIDMVVASVLMSMGMMMLPPVFISLPFKLIFFVLVDGWYLLSGSLVRSFSQGPGG
ncbi:MAG: flagellar type III secretion system pore protein FliP [Alphaproteobacteria bacterium]|nr:flagellar type III secretion system pore protein FliP [Alphaproteobacteria bacterium]